jgi:hypothetical protein
MEGVAGEGIRRRNREYSDEVDEAKVEDLTAAELTREKLRTREMERSDGENEASTKEAVEHVVSELQEEEKKEGEVFRKLSDVLDELEREELEAKSTEEKLREVLEDLDEQKKETQKISETMFSSREELEKILQHHQHVQREFTSENYEKCEQFLRVVSEKENVANREIAEQESLDERVVSSWREGVRPRAVLAIEGHENKRIEHESQVPDEALEHRISPEEVNEVISEAMERENHSVKELTDIVQEIHTKIDNPEPGTIHYAELYDSDKSLAEDKLRDIALEIRSNREVIQSELNTRLELDSNPDHEVRIAVTDSRLYYWHVSTSPDDWANVLADQKLYMSKEGKLQLVEDMTQHLHVRGGGQTSEYYLNDIISQLTDLENPAANRIQRYCKVHSLDGEVMHLVGDLQGKSIEEYKDVITHIGIMKSARVSNPKFPEIHEFRMRFVAIAESDCHLDDEGRFSYYEKDKDRLQIAIDFFQEFGDFDVKLRKDNKIQLYLPRTFGVLAEYWGIPRGDKAIHNKGLHESVINDAPEVKVYYPREMVPEDGCISGNIVSVRRHNVLHAGKHAGKYREEFGIEPLVEQRHIQLVIDEGTPQKAQLCYEEGELTRLHITEIKGIARDETNKYSHVAGELLRIINGNAHQLLSDEVTHILAPLGIEMDRNENFVQYYRKSQRLALSSSVETTTTSDAIRWVLIAPPNHPSKMERAKELIVKYQERSKIIAEEIKNDGLLVDSVWEEYLN